jgi:hypothetical protein
MEGNARDIYIFKERFRISKKTPNQEIRSPDRDPNVEPPKYNA